MIVLRRNEFIEVDAEMGVEMGISLGLRYPPYPPILCPFSSFAGATRGAAKPPAASFPLRAQPAPHLKRRAWRSHLPCSA